MTIFFLYNYHGLKSYMIIHLASLGRACPAAGLLEAMA